MTLDQLIVRLMVFRDSHAGSGAFQVVPVAVTSREPSPYGEPAFEEIRILHTAGGAVVAVELIPERP